MPKIECQCPKCNFSHDVTEDIYGETEETEFAVDCEECGTSFLLTQTFCREFTIEIKDNTK